jgi:hypothetical protein
MIMLVAVVIEQPIIVLGMHIDNKKFTVFDQYFDEVKGIVVGKYANGDLFIIPDPSYLSLLLEANYVVIPDHFFPEADIALQGYKQMQDAGRSCNLPVESYKQPFPIIKLERYKYDLNLNESNFSKPLPNVTDPPYKSPLLSQYQREVQLCDHVKVTGHFVYDSGHWMYSSDRCA